MTQINFPRDDADDFLKVLLNARASVEESIRALAVTSGDLHEAFAGDQKYVKYEATADGMRFALQGFVAAADAGAEYLAKLISIADEFLDNSWE